MQTGCVAASGPASLSRSWFRDSAAAAKMVERNAADPVWSEFDPKGSAENNACCDHGLTACACHLVALGDRKLRFLDR